MGTSMVVGYLHFKCVAGRPSKANAKLIVDANCVLAFAILNQRMQIKPAAGAKIIE